MNKIDIEIKEMVNQIKDTESSGDVVGAIELAKKLIALKKRQLAENIITHNLKTLPKYFKAAISGAKTFEVRKDDRDFQVGDILQLQKYDNGQYLKDIFKTKITYVLGRNDDEKQFVKTGYVILGMEPYK